MKQIHLKTTASTNDDALRLIRESLVPEKLVIFTQEQTQGRGTRGRVWESPKQAVLATLVYPISHPLPYYVGVTLSIGVAIARSLRALGAPVHVKWPNDIVCRGKKLAGILVEQAQSQNGQRALAIGIGLNIELNGERTDRIGFVDLAFLSAIDCDTLGERLVRAIEECLQEFELFGFEPTYKSWSDYGAYIGRFVDVFQDDIRVLSGQLKGINNQGALLIVGTEQEHCVTSGTLRVRKYHDGTC